jgi:hydrogenase/urease accessory protein HupE
MKALALALGLFCASAGAHELQPGFLELAEKDVGRYEVFWKQPPSGGAPLRLTPVFPAACQPASEARGTMEAGAWLYRTTIQCQPALAGQTIAIEGLEAFPTDVLVRVQHASGTVETHLLKPERPSITLGSGVTPLPYVVLGIEHIALGVDHLLFVLGLLLIVRSRWVLVKTITAFTVSHSIALAAATFSVISVPSAPLNAAIALSILVLGPEIVRTWRGESSFTIRHPWAVAFLFGLLHGFGFASGLTSLGLPREEIPLALLLFNLGVEIGQLAFVLVVVALERAFRVLEMRWPAPALRFPGYVVGTLGAFWTLSTVTAMVAR